ncbi:MAG: hypothetical protein L0Y55_07760, partial [Anaerolineales bacterium]|nr:hypothetical protein [Anaerolineales bacterium]
IDALTDAIIRALTDQELRAQMIARGLAHAARFSWERAGRATTALYRTVLAESHRGVVHATR